MIQAANFARQPPPEAGLALGLSSPALALNVDSASAPSRWVSDREMFPGFTTSRIDTSEVSINMCHGGQGQPVLLLHGYPQTHVMWHRIAPELARQFTVVCPDLRGYGDSDKPAGTDDHASYFAIVAHDRGARVALRLTLDPPARSNASRSSTSSRLKRSTR